MTKAKKKPKTTKPSPANLAGDERLASVLRTWNTVITSLKILTPDEILKAIDVEKTRPLGPRTNILYRLAQRHEMLTKNERIQKLVEMPRT